MRQGDLEAAIALLRKSMAAMPSVYTPANNLALCLMTIGKLDEAIRVQQESLKTSPLSNPFGLANLATLYLLSGDEINYRRKLDEALTLEMPSEDACSKVCEALSRFRRHQDILDLINASRFADAPHLAFFFQASRENLWVNLKRAVDLPFFVTLLVNSIANFAVNWIDGVYGKGNAIVRINGVYEAVNNGDKGTGTAPVP